MEDKKFYDGIISMKRLQLHGKLMDDCSLLFEKLSEKKEVLPKKFRKKNERKLLSTFGKGLKIIHKRCPVYIELPEFKSVGNGMTREIDSKTKEPVNNEVQVTTIDTQIEDDMRKVIEYQKEEEK